MARLMSFIMYAITITLAVMFYNTGDVTLIPVTIFALILGSVNHIATEIRDSAPTIIVGDLSGINAANEEDDV